MITDASRNTLPSEIINPLVLKYPEQATGTLRRSSCILTNWRGLSLFLHPDAAWNLLRFI